MKNLISQKDDWGSERTKAMEPMTAHLGRLQWGPPSAAGAASSHRGEPFAVNDVGI